MTTLAVQISTRIHQRICRTPHSSPPLDEGDQTIRAAATVLASALAGLGSR